MKSENKIVKLITKTRLVGENSDFKFWQTKSYAERLAALEEIRQEFNGWKYDDAEQGFQRVYRIAQLKEK
jgi:DNA-binding transcriptional regulator/RsmH inhibitor MraZ